MSQVPESATRPDVAAMTARTIRTCQRASTLSNKTPVPFTAADAMVVVSNAFGVAQPSRTIDVSTVSVHALTDLFSDRLHAALADAITELEMFTSLPSAELTTREGLRAVLRAGRVNITELTSSKLALVASTKRTRAVLAVLRILETFDVVTPSTLLPELEGAWHDPIKHRGFDAVVNEGNTVGDANALSWAIIGFESKRHINLVWHQANKLERVFPDRDASDMLALGWMGLRTALRLYNPALGFSFSTYACTRITGAIRDGVRAENPVPKRLGTFSRKVAAAEEALAHGLGRAPTLSEVAEHLGVHLDELKILPRLQTTASIDEMESFSNERGSSPNWLVDDSDPADTAMSILRRDAVDAALATLHPEDAAAVRLLVMEGLRPAEAQEITGEAPRRLRVRRERALAALREQLADWDETDAAAGDNTIN
jgi:RNA polymerase sigma factor for flagellar operon FliA